MKLFNVFLSSVIYIQNVVNNITVAHTFDFKCVLVLYILSINRHIIKDNDSL
jgi:hypothetical protein